MDPSQIRRDPTDAEVRAARDLLAQLDSEAKSLGNTAAAAAIHCAMGRVYGEQLGDSSSAAVCYQNAFELDPQYRPNLESARRLFARAGRHEKALALHQREEALLKDPAQRAESLRAQATLLQRLGRDREAQALTERALSLAPDHPALLEASVDAALREKNRFEAAKLLVRSAGATRDPVQKAQLLRRAVLILEDLERNAPMLGASLRATPAELASLHDEALRKLYQADANDPVAFQGMLDAARASNDWEAVLRLCRQRAERTASPADRALVAAIAAYRLGRVSDGLAEVKAALEDNRRDGALLALRSDLAEQQKSADLAEILRERAEGCIEPSERAHLKFRAAMLLTDPLDKEQLLSEALAESPGDAAAIALHARLVSQRDPAAAGDRFAALAEVLESHSGEEAAAHYLEAGLWHERAGNRADAATLAERALRLVPRHAAALRLLSRTLPGLGRSAELADVLERASAQLPRALGAELLARAATLASDAHPERAAALAQRAAEMARGLMSPRWLETWSALAFKAGDLAQLSQALEARADSTHGADAADLLLEASELSRAVGDEPRSTALLRKARGVDPASAAARNALLALPALPATERIELLADEARHTTPERAAALHAERAAVLESEGRNDEAVQACTQALAVAGADLAVLRRLSRLQLRRGDHAAALAVLVQIAEAIEEPHPKAEAYGRAAEVAEWRVGDAQRAAELYRAAAEARPQAAFAWAQLGRLLAWSGAHAEAARAYEELSTAAQSISERNEARRWAASLYAHRANQPTKAAALLRAIVADAAGDLEAAADLLALIGSDGSPEACRERAELRAGLASRCQDPGYAALLRSQSAEDRFLAGDQEAAIAEYRRALALNPEDRVALDRVEDALRHGGERLMLAEHLAFRAPFADAQTRAALALQQAEIFTDLGRLEDAGNAYQQALASDPDSLLALKGARHIAEVRGDKELVMRLLTRETELARDASTMVEAALLAEDIGNRVDALAPLSSVLESGPANAAAAELELRADAAERDGRPRDAAESLQALLAAAGDDPRAPGWRTRLGRLHAALGEPDRALSLLLPSLETLDPALLLALAPGAQPLPAADAARVYGRLLEVFPAAGSPAPSDGQLAEWAEALGRRCLALGRHEDALRAFRRVLRHDGHNPAALRNLADLGSPADVVMAQRAYLETAPGPEPLRALASAFSAQENADAAFCATAVLVGAGVATAEERDRYAAVAARPPPVELPQLADNAAVHADGDGGTARDLLTAVAAQLARALPTDMSGGRGALVKGDNPVRRVIAALSRALGIAEPQLFLARAEPAVVAAVAGDAPGLLVGAEVPKRYSPRQQRFLYARALAHIRRGTHAVAAMPAARLAAVAAELIRLVTPAGIDLSHLPRPESALGESIARIVDDDLRRQIAPLAARAAGEETDWESLALGIRESAERAAMAICSDPAAALSIVCAELQGDLTRPEIARLARFAVSDAYFALRPK